MRVGYGERERIREQSPANSIKTLLSRPAGCWPVRSTVSFAKCVSNTDRAACRKVRIVTDRRTEENEEEVKLIS